MPSVLVIVLAPDSRKTLGNKILFLQRSLFPLAFNSVTVMRTFLYLPAVGGLFAALPYIAGAPTPQMDVNITNNCLDSETGRPLAYAPLGGANDGIYSSKTEPQQRKSFQSMPLQATEGEPMSGFIEIVSYNTSQAPVMGLSVYPSSSGEAALQLEMSDLADQINLVRVSNNATREMELFEIHVPMLEIETDEQVDYCVTFNSQGTLEMHTCHATEHVQKYYALNTTTGHLTPMVDTLLLNMWTGRTTRLLERFPGFLNLKERSNSFPLFGLGPIALFDDEVDACAAPPEGSFALFFVSLRDWDAFSNDTESSPKGNMTTEEQGSCDQPNASATKENRPDVSSKSLCDPASQIFSTAPESLSSGPEVRACHRGFSYHDGDIIGQTAPTGPVQSVTIPAWARATNSPVRGPGTRPAVVVSELSASAVALNRPETSLLPHASVATSRAIQRTLSAYTISQESDRRNLFSSEAERLPEEAKTLSSILSLVNPSTMEDDIFSAVSYQYGHNAYRMHDRPSNTGTPSANDQATATIKARRASHFDGHAQAMGVSQLIVGSIATDL